MLVGRGQRSVQLEAIVRVVLAGRLRRRVGIASGGSSRGGGGHASERDGMRNAAKERRVDARRMRVSTLT